MKVVLDTNVLVSALLSPFQPPARVLDLALAGEVEWAFDDRVLAEYREVLTRPKFTFDARAVEDLLIFIEQAGTGVATLPLAVALPDPDDVIFLEVAATTQATLVTGNLRHYPTEQCANVVVLSPSAFLDRWQQQKG